MTGTTVDAGQTSGGSAQDQGQASQSKDGKTDLATLPADVRELIQNLRAEAKEHREAKEALDAKVTELTEEVETAQAASRTMSENAEKAQRALTIRDLRETYGLDQKAEKFLTAETEEELKEQAEALSAFASPPKNDDDDDNGGDKPPAGGVTRVTDPAQTAEQKTDPDAERVEAFFGGMS